MGSCHSRQCVLHVSPRSNRAQTSMVTGCFFSGEERHRAGDASSATTRGTPCCCCAGPSSSAPPSLNAGGTHRHRGRARCCFRTRARVPPAAAALPWCWLLWSSCHTWARARVPRRLYAGARCSSCEGLNSRVVLSRLQTAATSSARTQVRIVCVPTTTACLRRLSPCFLSVFSDVLPSPFVPAAVGMTTLLRVRWGQARRSFLPCARATRAKCRLYGTGGTEAFFCIEGCYVGDDEGESESRRFCSGREAAALLRRNTAPDLSCLFVLFKSRSRGVCQLRESTLTTFRPFPGCVTVGRP